MPPPERGPRIAAARTGARTCGTGTTIAGRTFAAARTGNLRGAAIGGSRSGGLTGRGNRHGLFAKAAAGLILGDALALVLVAATLVVLALAGLGGFALLRFGRIALGAATGFLFLGRTIHLLAAAGIGQCVGAGIAFGIGQGPQHHAGAGRAGCRSATSGATLRCDLGRSRSRSRGLWRRSLLLDSSAGSDGTTLDRLDHHRLRAAMGEALAHHALFDGALQRQRLGRHVESLVARIFRIIHSAQILRVA